MKTLSIALGLILNSLAFAQTTTTTTFDQQIDVTRDTVRNLISDLRVDNVPDSLNVSDYREWEAGFSSAAEESLLTFEEKMAKDIIPEVQKLYARYNKVLYSSNLDENQKISLLRALELQIESEVPAIEKKYKDAIKELYFSHNLLIMDFKTSDVFYDKRGKRVDKPAKKGTTSVEYIPGFYKKLDTDIVFEKKDNIRQFRACSDDVLISFMAADSADWSIRYEGDRNDESSKWCLDYEFSKYQKNGPMYFMFKILPFDIYFQKLIPGCKSQSCVILKAAYLRNYISKIKKHLDKTLSFSFPQPTYAARATSLTGFGHLNLNSFNLNEDTHKKALSRTDLSEGVKKLPFEL